MDRSVDLAHVAYAIGNEWLLLFMMLEIDHSYLLVIICAFAFDRRSDPRQTLLSPRPISLKQLGKIFASLQIGWLDQDSLPQRFDCGGWFI